MISKRLWHRRVDLKSLRCLVSHVSNVASQHVQSVCDVPVARLEFLNLMLQVIEFRIVHGENVLVGILHVDDLVLVDEVALDPSKAVSNGLNPLVKFQWIK